MTEVTVDDFVAALVVLAEAGIPSDIQELLVRGDPSRSIKPNALFDCLESLRSRAEAERGTYEEILRTVCSYLELPQSESGPADDITLYDRALEAEDVMYRQTEAERVEHMNARYRAEATCEKLAAALERIPVKLRRMALDKFEEGKQAASINIRNAAQLAEDIAAEALSAYRNITTVNASGPKGETPENCRDGGAE